MAASRMSRIASCRLALLSLVMAITLAHVLSDAVPQENLEDVELITVPRAGDEFVAIAGAEGDDKVSTSPSDLKKNVLNKKFQKFHPKTEADWNFKGEGKKTDVFIKDAKDNRLLRIISAGLLNPRDVLPIVSNDAITSSQKTDSSQEMSVTVQPEGMSGVLNDGIAVDSDEKIIMEKKKNATKGKPFIKIDNDASTESEENVKINLDGNAGVQSPFFNKQKGTITVPAQKQISLSKGKENQSYKKPYENIGYDVIPLNKQKEKQNIDEGVFDFVDSPLSDKHLVPAGTAQTSRINVKKGPNGQDYEYEYIYYYYEDGDEATSHNNDVKLPKGNEIPVSTSGPTLRTTSSIPRISSTPIPRFTRPVNDDILGTRIKSTDVLNESVLPQPQPQPHLQQHPQNNRDKLRNEFKYTADNPAIHSQQVPTVPNKNIVSNEIHWQYDSSRFPGRQVQHQAVSQQPIPTVTEETIQTTKHQTRGRTHYNTITNDDSSFIATALPISTQQPRETQTRSKSMPGAVRQPGLELVDSNSFRTHSTNVPIDYENAYSPIQTFDTPRAKSLKQNTQDFETIPQNLSSAVSSTKSDTYKKESTSEYISGTERSNISPLSTEIAVDNTVPFSTLSENTLTTVYGAGLTDKAAHDLYAIYQQTQNEETVKNTIAQDDRTTIVDEPVNTYIHTNQPITSVFTTVTTTITTTKATTPTPTTTTPVATVPSTVPGRVRFRGSSGHRNKLSPTSTETASGSSDTTSESTEKSKSRFRPSHQREHGNNRVSAYGRRGFSSTSTISADGESSTAVLTNQETSSKSSWVPPPRTRYRGSSPKSESTNEDGQSTSSPNPRSNFDRYNSRRRQGLRTTSTLAPTDEEVAIKHDAGSVDTAVIDQQSTTYRSIRNRVNLNNPVRTGGLRPGAKLNIPIRGKHGGTSTTTIASVPLDPDSSGSADVLVEQKQTDEHSEFEEVVNDTTVSSTPSTTAASTTHSDPLTRLKNRSKVHMPDKGSHAKVQAQQLNNAVVLNQNRRNLVHNLLPRKKQPSTSTEGQELKEEKSDIVPRPVTEESADEVSKSDTEFPDNQPAAEVSSTTENKLSSRLTSRRRNFAGRKPGTLLNFNRQTSNEES